MDWARLLAYVTGTSDQELLLPNEYLLAKKADPQDPKQGPLPALSRLQVKTLKRTIVPMSVDEVVRFWSSFGTSRDLAIVSLMLFEGYGRKKCWI
jgi:hypothetical protein